MANTVSFVSGVDGGGALTLSVTVVTGTNCLIVHGTWATTGRTVSGITYGGVAMTILGYGAKPTSTGGMVSAILLNPPVGTADVSISFVENPNAAYTILSASMYSGVYEYGTFDMDTDLSNELGLALRAGFVESAGGSYIDNMTIPANYTQNQEQTTSYSKLRTAYKAVAKNENCTVTWTGGGDTTRVHSLLLYPAPESRGVTGVFLSDYGVM